MIKNMLCLLLLNKRIQSLQSKLANPETENNPLEALSIKLLITSFFLTSVKDVPWAWLNSYTGIFFKFSKLLH